MSRISQSRMGQRPTRTPSGLQQYQAVDRACSPFQSRTKRRIGPGPHHPRIPWACRAPRDSLGRHSSYVRTHTCRYSSRGAARFTRPAFAENISRTRLRVTRRGGNPESSGIIGRSTTSSRNHNWFQPRPAQECRYILLAMYSHRCWPELTPDQQRTDSRGIVVRGKALFLETTDSAA